MAPAQRFAIKSSNKQKHGNLNLLSQFNVSEIRTIGSGEEEVWSVCIKVNNSWILVGQLLFSLAIISINICNGSSKY